MARHNGLQVILTASLCHFSFYSHEQKQKLVFHPQQLSRRFYNSNMSNNTTPTIRPSTRSGGIWDPPSSGIFGSPTPSNSQTSEESLASTDSSSGDEAWLQNIGNQILPQGNDPPELDVPEARVDVEQRYWRIIFRDRRALIEQFGDDDMWHELPETGNDTYFIGRRVIFD